MLKLTSKQLRNKWLNFFANKNHLVIPSKSLVPINDPTLLWINSGVATLKDYFSGQKFPPHPRLVSHQKSLRTSDIEKVGLTPIHHTFFEMLGNFSIGDYFKSEAIEMAWEFLFEVLQLPLSKIYITYFKKDQFTYQKWLKLGIQKSHLIAGGRITNFWDMGSGPCGPDTEIFFDRGSKYDQKGIELIVNNIDNQRYVEIWNIVFSEFNNDGSNNYSELLQKNIDTGAGLERITAILQDAQTNFDTDLFLPIISKLASLTNHKYIPDDFFSKDVTKKAINQAFKIVVDHIRAIVNAIQDKVLPTNIGRGYIIRRLIRRAYRFGLKLEIEQQPFLFKLVKIVKETLPYQINVAKIAKVIKQEELLFLKTITQEDITLRIIVLEKRIGIAFRNKEITAKVAFELFETYGYPIELTRERLAEKSIQLDLELIKTYQRKHIDSSRRLKDLTRLSTQIKPLQKNTQKISNFVGYDFETITSKIKLLFNDEKKLSKITKIGYVIFEETPFYATGGGQEHDQGWIWQNKHKIKLLDVFKDKYGNHVHKVEGDLSYGQSTLVVDHKVRLGLKRNHSATHLLFKALRTIYGVNKIKQLGSKIEPNRFRFDFPSQEILTLKDTLKIEKLVNDYIKQASTRKYISTTLTNAKKLQAIITTNEDFYGSKVRLVKFNNITLDVCGGTHVSNTSEIENFKIISLKNKGSKIYRIEAITSKQFINEWKDLQFQQKIKLIDQLITKIKKKVANYSQPQMAKNLFDANKLLTQLKQDYRDSSKIVKQIELTKLDLKKDYYINLTIPLAHQIKPQIVYLTNLHPKITFVLGTKKSNKLIFAVASKTKNALNIFQSIANKFNGNGGGLAIFAQGACDWNPNLHTIIKKALNE